MSHTSKRCGSFMSEIAATSHRIQLPNLHPGIVKLIVALSAENTLIKVSILTMTFTLQYYSQNPLKH